MMRKFIVILMMLFSFSVAWADSIWFELPSPNENVRIFIDKNHRKIGVYQQVWVKLEYLQNMKRSNIQKGDMQLSLYHVDCEAQTWTISTLHNYTKSGELIASQKINEQFTPIVPNTLNEGIARLICQE